MVKRLKNTFVHIPGIGRNTENQIWRWNIYDWNEFMRSRQKLPMSQPRKEMVAHYVEQSIKSYNNGDFSFFSSSLPANLHWRAYEDLKDKCCFLDIETTGLDRQRDEITVIGIYNGSESKFFVKDQNLDDFTSELKKYPMIITFNGTCFDIPFITAKYPDFKLNRFHIDLRFLMKKIGHNGGLKKVERSLGIRRPDEIDGVEGIEAIRLWYKYLGGNKQALDTLLSYNRADIENLKKIMDYAFSELRERCFLPYSH